MIKKIIFLVNSPLDRRDFERFGIELLMENGFEVEVWDLTSILHPDVRKNYTPPDAINWQHCKVFNDKKHTLGKIRALSSETLVIASLRYNRARYFIYKAISDSKAEYAINLSNAVPLETETDKKQSLLLYLKKLRKVTVKKLLDHGFLLLPFIWLGIKPASLILAGGKQSLKYHYLANKTTEIVWAHTLDYDLYLKERVTPSIVRPTAVFLDEYLPFHIDWTYVGIKPPVDANGYYPLLNKFFSLVEEKLGLKVLIAAHPRSHYEKLSNYFDERKWIRGQTIKLVKESRLVLAHNSTALNFCNLFHKPVIFLTSSDLDKAPFTGSYIRAMANWFGKTPVFMDSNSNIDLESELKVSKKHYDSYRQAYIKTDYSEDLPFWQIVANRLKKRF